MTVAACDHSRARGYVAALSRALHLIKDALADVPKGAAHNGRRRDPTGPFYRLLRKRRIKLDAMSPLSCVAAGPSSPR